MSNRKHIHTPANIGEHVADKAAAGIGSWYFIIIQAVIMAIWAAVNTLAFFHAVRFDSYPFVFLNLAMSAEAAFSAPIIMMSQNRASARDRRRDDIEADEVQSLTDMNKLQLEILGQQNEMLQGIEALRSEMAVLRESVPKRRVSR